MREILFRGKRKDGRGWAYGFYIRTRAFEYIYCYDREEFSDSVFTCHAIIPETVGQYTGLKDKNGKNVFDGDVLKSNHSRLTVVAWSKSQAGFTFMQDGIPFRPSLSRKASIVGNIHDTPELLKETPDVTDVRIDSRNTVSIPL